MHPTYKHILQCGAFFRGGFFREGVFRGSVNTVEPLEIDEALNPDAISRISEITTSAASETSTIASSR